ncbi:MAG TPA: histidine phosphatase family protein [Mycobacteriales bacterium]|nr:histidine phosphatase family protein [Mycobacteriales bacterium]
MALTLVLIRHAKAMPEAPSDIQRRLAGRGKRDAAAAGQWLADLGIAPDLVVISPATRAQETWDAISATVTAKVRRTDDRIYSNTVRELREVIADTADDVQTLVLVGHNPSMHGLAITLSDGAGDPEAEIAIRADYPTCGIAVFDADGEWLDLELGDATIRAFEVPRG